MVFDYHTHIGTEDHWVPVFLEESRRMRKSGTSIATTIEAHQKAAADLQRCVVVAFRSIALDFTVFNATFPRQAPPRYAHPELFDDAALNPRLLVSLISGTAKSLLDSASTTSPSP